MHVEKILSALNSAWDELIDFPLPEFVRRYNDNGKLNELTAAAFALLGFIIGGVIVLLASLVDSVIGNLAAALVFALAGWAVLSFRDSGRGDSKFGKFLSSCMKNYDAGEGGSNILMLLPGMIKFVILLLLGLSGKYFYIAVLLTAAFAFQVAIVLSEECPAAFVERGEKAVRNFRITVIILGVLCFLWCRLGTLAALAVVFAGYNVAVKRLKRDGFSASNISFAGTLAELLLLVAGLLTI